MPAITKAIRTLDAVSRALQVVSLRLAGGLVIAMLVVVGIQVLARYVFASPPPWTEELARWLMIWAALIGASAAFRLRADPVMVDPPPSARRRRKVQVVARFVAAWAFFLPVLWLSWPYVLRQLGRTSDGLGVSPAWMAAALPICAILICLHALAGLAELRDEDDPDQEDTAKAGALN